MNINNMHFLERNGINPEEMRRKVDCRVHNQSEINRIVYDYGCQTEKKMGEVSLANIVGYYNEADGWSRDIFESMDNFFSTNGTPYHRRSVGMLEYDRNNIMENLKNSFLKEPISLCESGEGTYTIFTNGLHRFTLLRILYLKELSEANGNPEQIKRVNAKYTVPASIVGIDLEQTYCTYLLKNIPAPKSLNMIVTDIGTYYSNTDYKPTDKVFLRYIQNGEMGKKVISKGELVKLTGQALEEYVTKEGIPWQIADYIEEYPSFKKFMSDTFPDVMHHISSERGEEHV